MTVQKERIQPLTEKQEAFVDAFLSEENLFNPIRAYLAAGYAPNANNYREAMKVLNKKVVVREINRRMGELDTAFWINEKVIVRKLWEEATREGMGSSQAARINALVWIGKHIGMWKEKSEERDTTPQIQIIQYGMDGEKVEKELNRKEVVEQKDSVKLPEGVVLTSYSDEDNVH